MQATWAPPGASAGWVSTALLEAGGILVATGHDHAMLERLCDRGLCLRHGRLVADGGFEEVRRAYIDGEI